MRRYAAVCVQRYYIAHNRNLRISMFAQLKKVLHNIGRAV